MPTIGAPIKRAIPPRAVTSKPLPAIKISQQTRAIVAATPKRRRYGAIVPKIQNATKYMLNDKNTVYADSSRSAVRPATGRAISIVQMTLRRTVEVTGTSHGTAYAEQFTTANSATSATPVQRTGASSGVVRKLSSGMSRNTSHGALKPSASQFTLPLRSRWRKRKRCLPRVRFAAVGAASFSAWGCSFGWGQVSVMVLA